MKMNVWCSYFWVGLHIKETKTLATNFFNDTIIYEYDLILHYQHMIFSLLYEGHMNPTFFKIS